MQFGKQIGPLANIRSWILAVLWLSLQVHALPVFAITFLTPGHGIEDIFATGL
jgi:hypothetical protein